MGLTGPIWGNAGPRMSFSLTSVSCLLLRLYSILLISTLRFFTSDLGEQQVVLDFSHLKMSVISALPASKLKWKLEK